MPYIGKKPENIIATAVDSTTGDFSGNVTAGGTLAVTGETTLATHLNMGDSDKIKLGASGDLEVYHDGSNSFVDDTGTGSLFLRGESQVIIGNMTGEQAAVFNDDGAVTLNHDNSAKLATSSSGITVTGDIANASGDLTLDVAGDITLNADGGDIKLADGSTTFGELTNNAGADGNFDIKCPVSDADIRFKGVDGGSDIQALLLDMSDAGTAVFNNRIRAAIASDGTPSYSFGTDTHTGMFSPANDHIAFSTGGTERLRIDSGARLAFGNTDTNAKITVSQDGSSLNIMRLQNTDGGHSCTYIQFANSGNNSSGNITQTGSNTVAYNTSSDYRLKENISYNFDATTRLKQLKPARFNFIDDGTDKTMDGFIAHEVSSIVPEAVNGTKDATRDIGTIKNKDGDVTAENAPQTQSNTDENETWEKTGTENIYQGIDHSKLVPLLTKALQEAVSKIETLEASNTALEARIVTLENA